MDILKNVDASPKLILSSIELKYGLENRKDILDALSQTAINGSWANENWLVYFADSRVNFDEDCRDFAKANGIGVIKISLTDDNQEKLYYIDTLFTARQNNTLQLNSEFGSSRKILLNHIIEEIQRFNNEGSYMDQDGDYAKLGVLLLQALKNCVKQKNIPERIELFIQDFDKFKIFSTNKSFLYSTLPTLILKDKIDKADIIKKQIGDSSKFSYNDLEHIVSLIKKLESNGSNTAVKEAQHSKTSIRK